MALIKPVKVYFSKDILFVEDFTDFSVYNASNQVVKLTLPGAVEATTITNLGFYVTSSTDLNPMRITSASAGAGDVFPDGIYRLEITQITSTGVVLSTDEYLLYIPAIDKCILKKTDNYLRSSCDNCKSDSVLKLLQELVIIRQAVRLDLNLGQYAAAAQKVTLLTNLCTGSSCKCICGC